MMKFNSRMKCTTILPILTILLFLVKIGQTEEIKPARDYPERVIHGSQVWNGEAPWQVALFLDGKTFLGGGSLIQKKTVLTAAHCLFDDETNKKYDVSRLQVRYNTLQYKNGPTLKVRKSIAHPSYINSGNDNDIGILHLAEPIQEGTNAKVIDLIANRLSDESIVNITGWGRYMLGSREKPLDLLYAPLTLYSQAKCEKMHPRSFKIDQMLCAGSPTQSACKGDSGGPVTHQGRLVGVISYGNVPCRPQDNSDVFTDVTAFSGWIQENMYPTESWNIFSVGEFVWGYLSFL